MDSFAAPNAASPKRKSSDPYTQPTGVKKIKIAKGGEIKKMAPLFDPDNSPSLQPNTTPLHQEKYDARSQASIKKTKSDPFTPLADAISNSAEQHGDDFDIFIEYPTPLQIREQEAHEKAVLRAKVLTLPHPVANPKPKPAAAPVAVATPIMEATVAGPQPTAPDFSQRLSLRRMKTAAGNTLEQRRKALDGARAQIESIIQMISSDTAKKPLEKIERTLIEQIKQVDADIEKLQLFGLGFQTNNIKGIDDKAIVALASWGINAEKRYRCDGEGKAIVAITDEPASAKEFFQVATFLEAGHSGDKETSDNSVVTPNQKSLTPAPTSETTLEASLPATKPSLPKPCSTPSIFMKPKHKRTNATIARAPLTVPTGDINNKNTSTDIVDAEVALMAELAGKDAKKGKGKGNKGFVPASKIVRSETNSRFRVNDDGEVIFKKRK